MILLHHAWIPTDRLLNIVVCSMSECCSLWHDNVICGSGSAETGAKLCPLFSLLPPTATASYSNGSYSTDDSRNPRTNKHIYKSIPAT